MFRIATPIWRGVYRVRGLSLTALQSFFSRRSRIDIYDEQVLIAGVQGTFRIVVNPLRQHELLSAMEEQRVPQGANRSGKNLGSTRRRRLGCMDAV